MTTNGYKPPTIPTARWRITEHGTCRHAVTRKRGDTPSVCGIAGDAFQRALPPPKRGERYFPACERCVGKLARTEELRGLNPKVFIIAPGLVRRLTGGA